MSPEQCMGKSPDPRTDLYALGCVAFELITGETPFKGVLAQMFVAHVKKSPPAPSQITDGKIPPELDALVLRCLAKPPEARFQTGGELAAAVRNVPGYRPLRRPPAQ
jgi:serine/threonine-protein kinase